MGFTKKNYIDLTGLTTFKTAILSTAITDVNKTNTKTTATIKAIADYVDSEVGDLSDAVTTALAGKVSSVSYDSTNKKLIYNKGGSTNTDIVSIATIKSDIGNFVKSGTGASSGLVPAPSTTAGTSKYLREDGTWTTPPDTTYTASSGITLDGKIFKHSNSITAGTASEGGSARTLAFGGTFKVPSVTYDAQGHVTGTGSVTLTMPANPNTDTHYTAKNVVASSSTGTANVSAVTSDPYLNLIENGVVRSTHHISGSGATSVKTDASGNIIISSTDNNTTYSAGTGISLSGTTFSNSGVRSIATGSANGTISVNTNGTSADVAVKGLGSNAYTSTEYIPASTKGSANGVASLGSDGKVPSSQLPSYVDDVLEYTAKSGFPKTGETGKIYVDTETNLTYRWSGSAYVEISPSIALGETSSTAYAGDKGATLATNLSSHTGDTIVHITDSERTTWDGKYAKPSSGIPKTDLASAVQTSLGKADSALQSISATTSGTGNAVTSVSASGGSITVNKSTTFLTSHQDISGKENTSNKVTAWSSTTTDTHYPSEKLVKDSLDKKVDNFAKQNVNVVFAGPSSGSSTAVPAFRSLVDADLPTVPYNKGGTGLTSYNTGDILYASSATAISKLKIGDAGQVLKVSNGVPIWSTDNDHNYYPTAFTWTNGTTSGPTGSLTGSGMSAVSFGAIPSASASVSGVVTTGDQTFKGVKTFSDKINIASKVTLQYNSTTESLDFVFA